MSADRRPFFRLLGILAAATVIAAACSSAATSQGAGPSATRATAVNPTESPAQFAPPEATPAASALASAAPQLVTLAEAPNYEACPDGNPDSCVPAGTYGLGSDVVPSAVGTVVIPGGWFEWDMGPGTEGLLVERADAKDGSGWGVLFSSVGRVSRNPCDSTKGMFPASSTSSVDGLIAAMRSWPGFQVGAAKAVTLGGVAGKQVAVMSTKTSAACPDPVIWQTPQGTGFNGYPEVGDKPKGYTAQFLILNVDGALLVLRTTDFPQTTATELGQGVAPDARRHSADQQTLHAILDSLRFDQGS